MARLVVADDAALFREGLVHLLTDAGHQVVAAVADADALVTAIETNRPDLAVVDVRMPPDGTDDGVRAALVVRERTPGLPVLLLSQHIEIRHATELAGTSAFGYLLKDRVLHVDDFLDALDRVAGGGVALDPEVVAALVGRRAPAARAIDQLTDREREVLALVAEGLTNSAVARRLVVSERTVEAHLRATFLKLGLPNSDDDHRRVRAVLTYLAT